MLWGVPRTKPSADRGRTVAWPSRPIVATDRWNAELGRALASRPAAPARPERSEQAGERGREQRREKRL